jgi:hypothetical protein
LDKAFRSDQVNVRVLLIHRNSGGLSGVMCLCTMSTGILSKCTPGYDLPFPVNVLPVQLNLTSGDADMGKFEVAQAEEIESSAAINIRDLPSWFLTGAELHGHQARGNADIESHLSR